MKVMVCWHVMSHMMLCHYVCSCGHFQQLSSGLSFLPGLSDPHNEGAMVQQNCGSAYSMTQCHISEDLNSRQ